MVLMVMLNAADAGADWCDASVGWLMWCWYWLLMLYSWLMSRMINSFWRTLLRRLLPLIKNILIYLLLTYLCWCWHWLMMPLLAYADDDVYTDIDTWLMPMMMMLILLVDADVDAIVWWCWCNRKKYFRFKRKTLLEELSHSRPKRSSSSL